MRAVVVLRNDSYRPLKFDDYKLELQIYDEDQEKITTTQRHESAGSELPPWDQDRIAFIVPDKEKRVKSGEVFLMDSKGKVISRMKVLPAD